MKKMFLLASFAFLVAVSGNMVAMQNNERVVDISRLSPEARAIIARNGGNFPQPTTMEREPNLNSSRAIIEAAKHAFNRLFTSRVVEVAAVEPNVSLGKRKDSMIEELMGAYNGFVQKHNKLASREGWKLKQETTFVQMQEGFNDAVLNAIQKSQPAQQ